MANPFLHVELNTLDVDKAKKFGNRVSASIRNIIVLRLTAVDFSHTQCCQQWHAPERIDKSVGTGENRRLVGCTFATYIMEDLCRQ